MWKYPALFFPFPALEVHDWDVYDSMLDQMHLLNEGALRV